MFDEERLSPPKPPSTTRLLNSSINPVNYVVAMQCQSISSTYSYYCQKSIRKI